MVSLSEVFQFLTYLPCFIKLQIKYYDKEDILTWKRSSHQGLVIYPS